MDHQPSDRHSFVYRNDPDVRGDVAGSDRPSVFGLGVGIGSSDQCVHRPRPGYAVGKVAMPETKPKRKKKIADHIETGEEIGEIVKKFTPDEVDVMIDRGTQIAKVANGIKSIFGGLFGKKKQL